MAISTTILITIGLLAIYYIGMISHDLYLQKIAQAIKDDDNEMAVDISDQVNDFQSIPVNKPEEENTTQNRFENLLRAGITAEKASRFMDSIADGTPLKELENVMYIIQEHQTTSYTQ